MSKKGNADIRSVAACEKEIQYHYHIKKVKNINLRIKPDGSVHVSASRNVPPEYVDRFVLSRAQWIFSSIEKFGKNIAKPVYPEEGEKISFLGKPYVLRLFKRTKPGAVLRFEQGELYLFVPDLSDEAKKREVLQKWQRFASEEILPKVFDRMWILFESEGISKPVLQYRKMRARWGSCSYHQKKITINTMLIEAPLPAIEYVLVHELAHLIHPNHSKEFHRLVESKMPDWRERKELLGHYYHL